MTAIVLSQPPLPLAASSSYEQQQQQQEEGNFQEVEDGSSEPSFPLTPPPSSSSSLHLQQQDYATARDSNTTTCTTSTTTATTNDGDDDASMPSWKDNSNNNNNNDSQDIMTESLSSAAIDQAMDEILLEEEQEQEPEHEEQLEQEQQQQGTSLTYGGLSNLGNTCYMASALQMLASLEGFVQLVNHNDNEEDEQTQQDQQPCCAINSNNDDDDKNELRTVFLNVMQRLQRQRVVHPREFKKVMDEKSPLFVGYQQQDSHEFLTAFLDMLDEEYKKKTKKEEESNMEEEEEEKEEGDNASTHREEEQQQEEDALMEDTSESACKKLRTGEKPMDNNVDDDDYFSMKGEVVTNKLSTGSFSQLDVDGIGDLLHDYTTTTTTTALTVCDDRQQQQTFVSPSVSNSCCTQQEPSPHGCKLIGGRMNTTDVVLTPYESSSNNLPPKSSDGASGAAATAASSLNHDMRMDDSDDVDDSGSTNSEQEQSEDDDVPSSPVDSYFTTSVRVRLTCDSCKYTRTHIEKFLHLSLEIGSDDNNSGSVEDGLRRFFAPERREVKCEKCFCDTATQTTEITQLPRALLLHFKRFLVDVSPDYSSISYRKNRSRVAFDENLFLEAAGVGSGVLTEFLAPDCSLPEQQQQQSFDGESSSSVVSNQPYYSLVSVVNHIGSSASCGHYTADAKRLYYDHDSDDGTAGRRREWTRFNDAHVSRITSKQAIEESRKTAYMVLYELS